jgi:hypothetical protein
LRLVLVIKKVINLEHIAMKNFNKNLQKIISLPGLMVSIFALALAVPKIVLAGLDSLQEYINQLVFIVAGSVTALLAGVVFVMFILNVIRWFQASNDPNQRKDLKSKIILNLVIMIVFVAIWGITGAITNWLGIGVGGSGTIPGIGVIGNN